MSRVPLNPSWVHGQDVATYNLAMREAAGFVIYRLSKSHQPEFLLLLSRKHGEWGFPKGHRDDGDVDLLAAARRECREEAGIEPCDVHPGFRHELTYIVPAGPHIPSPYPKQVTYFLARADDAPIVLSDEHVEYRWVTRAGAERMLKRPDLIACLRAAAAEIGKAGSGQHENTADAR